MQLNMLHLSRSKTVGTLCFVDLLAAGSSDTSCSEALLLGLLAGSQGPLLMVQGLTQLLQVGVWVAADPEINLTRMPDVSVGEHREPYPKQRDCTSMVFVIRLLDAYF